MRRRAKGSGTVVQIGPSWYAKFVRHGKSVYGQAWPTRDEAEADRVRLAAESATRPKGAVPTVREWAHECMAGAYGRNRAASTFETNESIRLKHLNPSRLGSMRLDRVAIRDVQEWADGLSTPKGGRPSPATVRRIVAFVSKVFSLAERDGLIQKNPCVGLDLPSVVERDNRVLDRSEVVRLLNPRSPTEAMFLVAVGAGLRRAEVARLKWQDVDLAARTAWVAGTKSSGSRRFVPLGEAVASAIGALPRSSEHVFPGKGGRARTPASVGRAFSRAKAGLGLPPETRLQDLRGTFASLLIEAGADPKSVQELLGHASLKTTMKAYARAYAAGKRALVDNLFASAESPQTAPADADKVSGQG